MTLQAGKINRRYFVVCRSCGCTEEYDELKRNVIRGKLIREGWARMMMNGELNWFCPECVTVFTKNV